MRAEIQSFRYCYIDCKEQTVCEATPSVGGQQLQLLLDLLLLYIQQKAAV